jgi:hypothetical protein
MELSVIPVYQSEIMPAPVRGFAVASYQMSFVSGTFPRSPTPARKSEVLPTDSTGSRRHHHLSFVERQPYRPTSLGVFQ